MVSFFPPSTPTPNTRCTSPSNTIKSTLHVENTISASVLTNNKYIDVYPPSNNSVTFPLSLIKYLKGFPHGILIHLHFL